MKRNTSIEVFRCLLMFGIVFLHCCSQGPITLLTPYRLCMSCVTGFVFISGYFGIKFSWKKVAQLVFTAVVCALISFGGEVALGWPRTEYGFYEYVISGNWFLWAYVVLMMIAPIIDNALASAKSASEALKWSAPLLITVFGWNFLTGMPVVGNYLPHPVGFGTHTFLMMTGVYLAARLFKMSGLEDRIVGWKLYLPLFVGGVLCALGLSHYDSPVSLFFMLSLFVLCKRIEFNRVGKSAALIGPSMFSVYLLHWSPLGLSFINKFETLCLDKYDIGGGGSRFNDSTDLVCVRNYPRYSASYAYALLQGMEGLR